MKHSNFSVRILLIFCFSFITLQSAFCQENKQFTLEDLIPGGKTFYNYYPRIPGQYFWLGDTLVQLEKENLSYSDFSKSKMAKESFLAFKDIQDKLTHADKITRLSSDALNPSILNFYTSKGQGIYNLEKKELVSYFIYPENANNLNISPDGDYMAFTRDNNLYILSKDNKVIALSNEQNKGIVYGQAVHRNEFGINGGIFWSPKGDKIAFYRMDETMVTDYPLVDISQRSAALKSIKYPMAGMTSHEVTLGVYDIKSESTVYMKTTGPKDHFLTNIAWNPEGTQIYIAELNREQNHMKLNRYDALTGKFDKTLFEETHPKYVEPSNPVMFIPKNPRQFLWQSRRDGFNHIYLYDVNGKMLRQLTKGAWDVTAINSLDESSQRLFFTAAQPSPLDRHIFSVNINNPAKITQYTKSPGMHNAVFSNSGRYILDRYSANDNPGTMDVIDTKTQKIYTISQAEDPFKNYKIPSVESGTINAADGKTDLYYRMIKPVDFDSSKKYPVAVYVYGGPHSQMVQNRWRYGSGGWEMYMAQKGYIVFVMDNRGTSFRGFDFENVIHRQLGVEESKDQMKGVEFLKTLPYVDASRMGIHGWSFGGFMTTTMLTRYPGVFKVGVAGGPVIDWKYYEVMYGERYMDTPQENPEGYKNTSLLNKAGNLKDRLLIIHGDIDPTVVLQNSLQFLKACNVAGTHPDYYIYTGHEHNMTGHERVHLHEHITRYFDDFCK